MPSVTINSSDLEKEGPILEVQFLISSDLDELSLYINNAGGLTIN